eukprot:GHVS01061778.1.p1 GENE.GHVS01061778.1~~GHVS01061778.1.p1  ORF type:complete len:131 (+),score=11.81 GHVS01061778.1:328-720(+)
MGEADSTRIHCTKCPAMKRIVVCSVPLLLFFNSRTPYANHKSDSLSPAEGEQQEGRQTRLTANRSHTVLHAAEIYEGNYFNTLSRVVEDIPSATNPYPCCAATSPFVLFLSCHPYFLFLSPLLLFCRRCS